jgi:hypothetical protein
MSEQEVAAASAAVNALDNAGTPELWSAFATAQEKFKVPKKTKTAKMERDGKRLYEYKYSTLDDLIEATRPALTGVGICVVQNPKIDGAKVSVSTILCHAKGRWISDPVTLQAQSSAAQHIGAALTYARRYSMSTTLGVAAEDDNDVEGQEPTTRKVQAPDDKPTSGSASTAPKAGEVYKGNKGKDDKKPAKPAADTKPIKYATKEQLKRMFSVAEQHGVTVKALKAFLADAEPPILKSEFVPADRYDGIIKAIQGGLVEEPKDE